MTIDTLGAMVRRAFDTRPLATFLTVPGGPDITYAEAEQRSGQLAGALARQGVSPGDRVAVQIEKSPTSVLVYLACIRLGAVLVPMNTGYTPHEVAHLVGDAEPSLLILDPGSSHPGSIPVLSADASGQGSLAEAAQAEEGKFSEVTRGPGDPAAILYTSGTTGRPKGAALTHHNLASNATTLAALWRFVPADVLLHALPLFHTHGLFVATNCVLSAGAGMVLLDRFDVDAVLDHLPGCSVFMGIPTFYTRLLADPRFTPARCEGVRLFTSGSAPMLASVHQAFTERTGRSIVERYGMTETSILTSTLLDAPARPGSVGVPLPGTELRVTTVATSTEGEPTEGEPTGGEPNDGAPSEPIGDIEVRGPNVFAGYWHRPELNATEFTDDGFFRTGDLGRLDEDGWLWIVGRSKDLVISGGYNVYPTEVEAALNGLDGVAESAVVGIPDDDLGERVVAVVVLSPGRAVDEQTLRAGARSRLAGYKVPKAVHVVPELPRNAMGKVEKHTLRRQLADGATP